MDNHTHPFEPFIDKNSKILILGTFPSIKSFEDNFYYAHPQNQFWKLLSAVFDEIVPKTIEEKKIFLKNHNIALWDMVKSCTRVNSLDSNLQDIKVNDIEKLLENYPNIQQLYLTSIKALKLYKRYFKNLKVKYSYLPSPSPAYAKMSFEEKLKEYKKALVF
jgi:hypoxanthine-DNA glycosylase